MKEGERIAVERAIVGGQKPFSPEERRFEHYLSSISEIKSEIVEEGNKGRNIVDVALGFLPWVRGRWAREALNEAAENFGMSKDEINSYLKVAAQNGQAQDVRRLKRKP